MDKIVFPQNIRALMAGDLARVVDIDTKYSLRSRHGFFEKRLAAALEQPKNFVYIGYEKAGALLGFALARLAEGEFGQDKPVAILDGLAVDPANKAGGIGRLMLAGLENVLRHKGISELHSEVDWRNSSMVQFLATSGFDLAPRYVLERDLTMPIPPEIYEAQERDTEEVDFSDPQSDDFTALARDKVPCRSLKADDLSRLIRIGKHIFGYDRSAYYSRKMAEVLKESGVQVSMAAELDGSVVGFVMARIDFGDFGRTEPAAVIDTLEVDPAYTHRHIGSALLSQLFANLITLRVDVVRTAVYWNQFSMLSFLEANKFVPSQSLLFRRRLF